MRRLLPYLLLFLALPLSGRAQIPESLLRSCPAVSDYITERVVCTSGPASTPDRDTGILDHHHTFILYQFFSTPHIILGDSLASDTSRSESVNYYYRVDTNNGWLLSVEYKIQMAFPLGSSDARPEFSIRIQDSSGGSIDPVNLEAVYSGNNATLWTQSTDTLVHLSRISHFICFDLRPLHGQTVRIHFNTTCPSSVRSYCNAKIAFECTPLDSIFHTIQCRTARTYSAPRGFRYRWTLAADTNTILGTNQIFTDYNAQYLNRLRCYIYFDSPTQSSTRHIGDLYVIPYREFSYHPSNSRYYEFNFIWDTVGYYSTSSACAVHLHLTDTSKLNIRDSVRTRAAHDTSFFSGFYRIISECDTLEFPDTTTHFTLPPGRYAFIRIVTTHNGCTFYFANNLYIPLFPCEYFDSLIRTCPDHIDICSFRYKCWYSNANNLKHDLETFPYEEYYLQHPYSIHDYHSHRNIDTLGLDPNTGNLLSTVPTGLSSSFLLGNEEYHYPSSNYWQHIKFPYHIDTSQSRILILHYAAVSQYYPTITYNNDICIRITDSNGMCINNRYCFCISPNPDSGWMPGTDDYLWKDWTKLVIDLQPYHGQTLYFLFTVAPVPQYPSQRYIYFQFQCLPVNIDAVRCQDTVEYEAPDGFSYEWFPNGHPDSLLSTSQHFTAVLPADSLLFCRLTDPSDTSIQIHLPVTPPPPQYPVARLSLDTLDILDDCSYLMRLINNSYIVSEYAPDSIVTSPCHDIRYWLDDTIPIYPDTTNPSPENSFIVDSGHHTLTLVATLSGTSCTDTIFYPFYLNNPCHCYDTLYDTIVQNQLPYTYRDFTITDFSLFPLTFDTSFFIPGVRPACDSIIDYHLRIYYNVADTLLYYACESELPVQYGDSLFYQEGEGTFLLPGSHGEDSLVTFILHVIPGSDTTIHDTITESQLPWYAFDTLFTDTVADYLYHLYNEAGCDSTIHYNLFIYWNGDHCDTTLEFPNLVTPNGDGHNDRFVIKGLIENNCFKYNELTIYDRYGHQVYHRRNIATDSDWWDPAARRHPAGTYFYYFKAHGVTIHTQHTGVIEVLRDK